MSKKVIAHILLFLVNLFYGAGFIVSKSVMPSYIQPQGFIMIRVVVTVFFFFLVSHFWIREKIEKKDWLLLFACAIFGVVANQELFFAGLAITTPINAALIMIMTPILVFVISFFAKMEKLTPYKLVGLFLGTAGAFIILRGKGFSFSNSTFLGDLFVLLNATSYAIYLVIVRPLMRKYHPITVIKWVFLIGVPFTVLFGYNQFTQIQWQSFSLSVWMAVFFVVFFTTFCAYLFNIIALREVPSTVVGAYIYLQPILATIIATFLGKDTLTTPKTIAAAFIFIGVYLVSFTQNKPILQKT